MRHPRPDGRPYQKPTAGNVGPGLYAAGEMVGGLFYHNYPGGSGLSAGMVFGRLPGNSAGQDANALKG